MQSNVNNNAIIYLDNNATTFMPQSVINEMIKWCNVGNPSAGYSSAAKARQMMDQMREYIYALTTLTDVIFTSGASEANAMIVNSVVSRQRMVNSMQGNELPHIIMSSIEHKSLIELAESYEERKLAVVTLVQPSQSGHIRPEDVEAAIRSNTCMICVMSANNETGAINDIDELAKIAVRRGIWLHTDSVQSFGKYPVCGADSMCISFHKLHGPPGVGVLCYRKEKLTLTPLVFGTQNNGLRGGTENVPGIGAAFAALRLTMTKRDEKNQRMFMLKGWIMRELGKHFTCLTYTAYAKRMKDTTYNRDSGLKLEKIEKVEIVFLSQATKYYLPNTLMLSVVKHTQPLACNVEIKNKLLARGIVVSVGSACNTASPKASHVLYAMVADNLIRKGALRISLGDETSNKDVKVFVAEFINIIRELV
jgi:cysteine desulfurase